MKKADNRPIDRFMKRLPQKNRGSLVYLFYFGINLEMIAGKMIIEFFIDYFVFVNGKTAGNLQHIVKFFIPILVFEIIKRAFVFISESLPYIGKIFFRQSGSLTFRREVKIPHDDCFTAR